MFNKSVEGPERLLRKMRNALPIHCSTRNSEWIGEKDNVGLGVIHPTRILLNSHYAEDSSRGVYCFFDGIVHVKADSKSDKTNISSGADLLLEGYLESGRDCLERYSGSFNVVWWDQRRQRLVIGNDKLGQRLIFYSQKNGNLAFASYLARVIESDVPSREIDLEAFADLIHFEYILGEKTLFKDIDTLPPGSILTYEHGQLNIQQYFHLHQIEPHGNYDENRLDELENRFRISVDRCIRSDIQTAIDLTGGLDSRCILAAAANMKLPFITHTGGQIDSTDVILAKQAAAITGAEHYFEAIRPDKMGEWLFPMVQFQNGLVASLHSHPCQHLEMPMPFDAVVQGIGISYVRGQWVSESDMNSVNSDDIRERLKYKLLSKTAKKINLDNLWKAEFKKIGLIGPQEHFNEILRKYTVPDRPMDVIDHVALVERCRKFLNKAIFIVRSVREAYFPYLDDEFIIALSLIPKSERANIRIQKDLIKRFYPKLLDVPWSKTLIALSVSPAKSWFIKKSWAAHRKFSGFIGIRNNTPKKKPNHNLAEWCRKEMRTTLSDLLFNANATFREYLDWQSVEPLLKQHFSGQNDWEHLIAALTVFEIANRLWRSA
jgi:asparagine synthase (glutamine-hydrolysing)